MKRTVCEAVLHLRIDRIAPGLRRVFVHCRMNDADMTSRTRYISVGAARDAMNPAHGRAGLQRIANGLPGDAEFVTQGVQKVEAAFVLVHDGAGDAQAGLPVSDLAASIAGWQIGMGHAVDQPVGPFHLPEPDRDEEVEVHR